MKNTLAYCFFDGGYNYQLIAWMANEKHASLSDESDNVEIKTR